MELKEPELKTKEETENTSNEKQKAKLENWYQVGPVLYGNVYDHPRHEDGNFVRTSRIIFIKKEIGIAETVNTVYILIGKEVKY